MNDTKRLVYECIGLVILISESMGREIARLTEDTE